MRRTLTALAILFALALPASASADHRDRANERDGRQYDSAQGFLTVNNPNLSDLQIVLNGEYVGEAAAQQTTRLGPFPSGRADVTALFVCSKRELEEEVAFEQVRIDRRHPARMHIGYLDLAIVELSNDWIEPMTVMLDGKGIGTMPARGHLDFIAPSGSNIVLKTPHGTAAMNTRVQGRGLQSQPLALVPAPSATVLVTNPSNRSVELLDRKGRVLCVLRPRSTERVSLPSGRARLVASYRGSKIDRTRIIASPFRQNKWRVDLPPMSQVSVRNNNRVTVDVFADGRLLGRVEPRDTRTFEVDSGRVEMRVEGRRGRSVQSEVLVLSLSPDERGWFSPRLAFNDGRGASECEYPTRTTSSSHRHHYSNSWSQGWRRSWRRSSWR